VKIECIFQLIKFGLVGFSNTLVFYFLYVILIYLNVPYLLANVIAFIVSVLNSFYWNNKYVFKRKEGEKRNIYVTLFKTFIAYAWTGLVLNNFLLVFFIEIIRVSKYLAPALVLIVTIPLNFLINKFWSFNIKKEKKENEEN